MSGPLRSGRQSGQRRARRAPAVTPGTAIRTGPSAVATGLTDRWASVRTGTSIWVRIRSGVVLTILLAVLGILVAVCVAGALLLLALAVRSAVG